MRFAECFEFNRVVWRGSEDQRQAVIDSLTPTFGTNHHRLLQRLDRQVNLGVSVDGNQFWRRSYLTISIRSGIDVLIVGSAAVSRSWRTHGRIT